jgi:hypothetical protein
MGKVSTPSMLAIIGHPDSVCPMVMAGMGICRYTISASQRSPAKIVFLKNSDHIL